MSSLIFKKSDPELEWACKLTCLPLMAPTLLGNIHLWWNLFAISFHSFRLYSGMTAGIRPFHDVLQTSLMITCKCLSWARSWKPWLSWSLQWVNTCIWQYSFISTSHTHSFAHKKSFQQFPCIFLFQCKMTHGKTCYFTNTKKIISDNFLHFFQIHIGWDIRWHKEWHTTLPISYPTICMHKFLCFM